MWLLFLVSWFRCDYFDCIDPDSYRCCVNLTFVKSYKIPGHHCAGLEYKLTLSKNSNDLCLDNSTDGYLYCLSHSYIPPSTPQISRTFMPTSTPARTYVECSAKCESKTKTSLKVQVVYAFLQ